MRRSHYQVLIDKVLKIIDNRCDLCNEHLTKAPDDIEAQIDKLVEVNNSYETEYDKPEPRLLLCDYCNKEYLIPNWIGMT